MRQRKLFLHLLIALALLSLGALQPVSADDEVEITPFYIGVSEYYGTPQAEVMAVRGHVRPEEVPVVFHIAEHAQVPAGQVLAMRNAGHSWMEISHRFGVGPEAYYVPLEREPGPPYGKAWGYYRNKPREKWNDIHLSDREVVDLVNLRFLSDHWNMDRHHVIEMRSQGHDHVSISRENWPYDWRHGHRPADRGGHELERDHDRDGHHADDRHHVDDRHHEEHHVDDRHHEEHHGDDRHGEARGSDQRHGDRGKGKDSKKHDDTPPRF